MIIKYIQVLSEAEADLQDGKTFYENQEQSIGQYFWDCLISDIESLIIYAGVHSKNYGFHRMTSKRFPYSIYYEVIDDTVFVVAVLPMRRNPNWIKSKLDKMN